MQALSHPPRQPVWELGEKHVRSEGKAQRGAWRRVAGAATAMVGGLFRPASRGKIHLHGVRGGLYLRRGIMRHKYIVIFGQEAGRRCVMMGVCTNSF